MWTFRIGQTLSLLSFTLCVILCRQNVDTKPLPEDKSSDGAADKATQSGEPSHFQVDDKAAEIEVNANPAGVKVNAKPASLQVVAKPGTPAIPIFHPAIHLAPHYSAPPLIHHHPASFYHGWGYPGGVPWMYGGLKRNKLPTAKKIKVEAEETSPTRTHKSDIPRAKVIKKPSKSKKRQFIQAAPQFIQQSQLAALGRYFHPVTLGAAPVTSFAASSLMGLGGLAPQYAPLSAPQGVLTPQTSLQESPLSRNMISSSPQSSVRQNTFTLPGSIGRSYGGLYQRFGGLQGQIYPGILGQQALSAYGNGQMGYGQAPGYARAYVPSPLAQMYATQPSVPQYTGILGKLLDHSLSKIGNSIHYKCGFIPKNNHLKVQHSRCYKCIKSVFFPLVILSYS